MSQTVESILEWKNDKNQFGIDSYVWFFIELKNNSISKLNGAERNATMIKQYDFDKEAIDFIVHQLYIIDQNAAKELINELQLDSPFISNENRKYLEPKSKFD